MKQLNVRVPDDLYAALEEFVKDTGARQSDVVRKGIGLAVGVRKAGAVAPPSSGRATPSAPEQLVDLATWVSNRAGIPKAIAARRISEGRVSVDGRPRYKERIPLPELRGQVTLDDEVI